MQAPEFAYTGHPLGYLTLSLLFCLGRSVSLSLEPSLDVSVKTSLALSVGLRLEFCLTLSRFLCLSLSLSVSFGLSLYPCLGRSVPMSGQRYDTPCVLRSGRRNVTDFPNCAGKAGY